MDAVYIYSSLDFSSWCNPCAAKALMLLYITIHPTTGNIRSHYVMFAWTLQRFPGFLFYFLPPQKEREKLTRASLTKYLVRLSTRRLAETVRQWRDLWNGRFARKNWSLPQHLKRMSTSHNRMLLSFFGCLLFVYIYIYKIQWRLSKECFLNDCWLQIE